jgi:hypothetical protein
VTATDRAAFAGLMNGLGEAFNEPVSNARARIYFEALEDLPIDALRVAVLAHVRSGKFFPRAAELRDAVLGNVEDQAEIAWQHVLREVRRVGWTGVPSWPDEATKAAALGLFGGRWRQLCEYLPAAGPELLGFRKQFVASYGAAARQAAALALPPSREEAKAVLGDLKAQLTKRGLKTGKL